MIIHARLAALAAFALCLSAAPAAFAQQSTTDGSSGAMTMQKGKDAGMSHSGSMMSTKKAKESGMAPASTPDDSAMSHSGDKMDKMQK